MARAQTVRHWPCGLLAVILAACTVSPLAPLATELVPTASARVPTSAPPTATSAPTTALEATATEPPAEPTMDATALIDSVVATTAPQSLAVYASPDEQLQVELLRSDCTPMGADEMAYEQLRLQPAGGGETQLLADQLLFCGGLGAFGLEGLYWSSDSRYFFYTTAREGQPDGGCGPWRRPIVRVDVIDGGREELAEGTSSPDGALTASGVGQDLAVWGRDQADILRVPAEVPRAYTGPIAWAPDGQSLVYLRWQSFCPSYERSYLVRLDLPAGEQSVLLDDATPVFADVVWESAIVLRLTDTDGQAWLYDTAADTLTQA